MYQQLKEKKNKIPNDNMGFTRPPDEDKQVLMISIDLDTLVNLKEPDRHYYLSFEVFFDDAIWEISRGEYDEGLSEEEFVQLYPLKSTTQMIKPMVVNEQLMAAVSMPVNLYLQAYRNNYGDKEQRRIKVLFELRSFDSWEINRYEGFGVLSVDPRTMHASKTVIIQKPMQSLFQRVKEFFIGGNYSIKDRWDFVYSFPDCVSSVSFYNRTLTYSCDLKLRVSTCIFSLENKEKNRSEYNEQLIKERVMFKAN